jgi:hypothetical protein
MKAAGRPVFWPPGEDRASATELRTQGGLCERTTDQPIAGNVRARRQWIPSHGSALSRELHCSPLSPQREINHNAREPLHGDASGGVLGSGKHRARIFGEGTCWR